MLPPISLLSTDVIESGPEITSGNGFYRDLAEFQASLTEALGPPDKAAQLPLPIHAGEKLPLVGNDLPVIPAHPDSTGEVRPAVAVNEPRGLVETLQTGELHEQTEMIDIQMSEESLQGNGSGDSIQNAASNMQPSLDDSVVDDSLLAVADSGPAIEDSGLANKDMEESRVETVADVTDGLSHVTPHRPAYRQTASQIAERTQGPSQSVKLPPVTTEAANAETLKPAEQAVELTSRSAKSGSPTVTDSRVVTVANQGMAPVDYREAGEQSKSLQKALNITGPQPGPTTTDGSLFQGVSQNTRIAPPPLVQTSVNIPVLGEGWGEALNERVTWMAGKSIQRAEIRLNPADMGPIRVEVSVDDDVAKIAFSAQNAVTREAIELALPRLREMLSENGIALAGTDISDTDGQDGAHDPDNEALDGLSEQTASAEDSEITGTTALVDKPSLALVDTYV